VRRAKGFFRLATRAQFMASGSQAGPLLEDPFPEWAAEQEQEQEQEQEEVQEPAPVTDEV